MDVWLDNTGFQSAGMFLQGKVQGDLSPVYHLATTIAFSSSLTLTGFEDIEVATMTSEIIEKLDSNRDVINMKPISSSAYHACCVEAARFCGSNFGKVVTLDMDEETLEYPAGLSSDSISKQIAMGLQVIFSKNPVELEDVEQAAKDQMAAGAAVYMLCCNSDLRIKSRKLFDNVVDKAAVYRQLENLLRYHLNTELARNSNGAIYTPALGRSKLIRNVQEKEYQSIGKLVPATELSRMLDSFKREVKLGAPSIHLYFEKLGNNDPDRILKTAFDVREKTGSLRKKLSSKLKGISSLQEYNETLDQEIEEAAESIRMTLGLDRAPRFRDAVDLSLVTALPPIAISLSGKELNEWWKFKKSSKRNALLTEISRIGRS